MDRASGEGQPLGILALLTGVGWVWLCCLMGLQSGEGWAEFAAEFWRIVGGGLFVIVLGFVGWTAGGTALKRPSAWLALLGILIVFLGLLWVCVACLAGTLDRERWAMISWIGWGLVAYGLSLLSPWEP